MMYIQSNLASFERKCITDLIQLIGQKRSEFSPLTDDLNLIQRRRYHQVLTERQGENKSSQNKQCFHSARDSKKKEFQIKLYLKNVCVGNNPLLLKRIFCDFHFLKTPKPCTLLAKSLSQKCYQMLHRSTLLTLPCCTSLAIRFFYVS